MSLVTAATAKKFINTSLADLDLQAVIDRIESQITEKIGAPWTDDTTPSEVEKTLRGGVTSLFLPTGIHAVVSIVEDLTELDADDYRVWGAGGTIERLPLYGLWGKVCVVTYQPVDDRFKRIPAIIDLTRLTLERTTLKSESIAGEYSYTAPDHWDNEFRQVMKRLVLKAV